MPTSHGSRPTRGTRVGGRYRRSRGSSGRRRSIWKPGTLMRPARIVVEPPIESCETATMAGDPPPEPARPTSTAFRRRLVQRDFAGSLDDALVLFLFVAAGRPQGRVGVSADRIDLGRDTSGACERRAPADRALARRHRLLGPRTRRGDRPQPVARFLRLGRASQRRLGHSLKRGASNRYRLSRSDLDQLATLIGTLTADVI
jgi:hypothetical protein